MRQVPVQTIGMKRESGAPQLSWYSGTIPVAVISVMDTASTKPLPKIGGKADGIIESVRRPACLRIIQAFGGRAGNGAGPTQLAGKLPLIPSHILSESSSVNFNLLRIP